MTRRRTILALLLAVAAVPAAPAASEAPVLAESDSAPATVIQDDAVFLHGSDDEIRTAVAQVRSLGIERVRITAGWSEIAPQRDGSTVPPGDLADPGAYPAENWRNLDRAVKTVTDGGLRAMIDIAFWAPRWATKEPPGHAERLREEIDPGQYARFAHAVARRYAGTVDLFTIWNEPNHPGFMTPQWTQEDGAWVPHSPHVYRAMVRAAYPAIKSAAPTSKVLIGGTSSMGSRTAGRGGVPPLLFLRELACVDSRWKPITTGRCADFAPIPGDGWSHHPYSLRTTPDALPRDRDNAPVANTPRLARTLRRLVAMGRLAPANSDIYMTEYGYETNPPDPAARFSPQDQPRLLAWAESIATRTPQVVMWPQFLLRDRPGGPAGPRMRPFGDWQTGLLDADGNPKPAFAAFRTPAHASCMRDGDRRVVEIWGRVRGDVAGTSAIVETRPRGMPGDGGWAARLSSASLRSRATRGVQTVAASPGAAVRRYVAWSGGEQLRIRWMSAGASGPTTVPVDATGCAPDEHAPLVSHAAAVLPGCPEAEEAGGPGGGLEGDPGDPAQPDGGEDDGPPQFSPAFRRVNVTIDASTDGFEGKELPISVEQACYVPPSLQAQADQLSGTDAMAVVTSRSLVVKDGRRVRKAARTSALAGADSVTMKGRLMTPGHWRQDEDGEPLPTFRAVRVDITD